MAVVRVYNAGELDLGPAVARANAGDTVEWPHLESCLGMLFILDDNSMVAGHVVAQMADGQGDDTPASNARTHFDVMTGLVGAGRNVVYFGTFGDDQNQTWPLYQTAALNHALRAMPRGAHARTDSVSLNCDDGGVDLSLDSTSWELTAPSHNHHLATTFRSDVHATNWPLVLS